jgi:protein involved in polysaccharide export with SLBB domain
MGATIIKEGMTSEGLTETQAGRRLKRVSVGTSTTLTATVEVVIQTAGGLTTQLWATPVDGDTVTIRNKGGAAANTIDGNGKNIEGAATFALNDGESITMVYGPTEWSII